MLIFFTNLSLTEFQQILGLFSVIDDFKWFWMVNLPQEYPVNAADPQGSILGTTLLLLYINDLPDDVICNVAIYANNVAICNDTTLYSKCDQASDSWQQLELACELEFDLRDNVDWDMKQLVDFNSGKLASFDWSPNTRAIDVKMDGSVLEEKIIF